MTAIYTATHEGQTASRKSARHIKQIYTHTIWAKHAKTKTWTCEVYTSRMDLAQARAREFSRYSWFSDVAIVPVTCEITLTARQKAWLAEVAAKGCKPGGPKADVA